MYSLIKNEKLGQKINMYLKVMGIDSICSKLLNQSVFLLYALI